MSILTSNSLFNKASNALSSNKEADYKLKILRIEKLNPLLCIFYSLGPFASA